MALMDQLKQTRGPWDQRTSWMEQLQKIKEEATAEAAEAPLDHWRLRLERLRGEIGADGVERITTQAIFDILEVLQRNRGAGASRRLAKLMTELGWTAVRVRARTRGDYREQVRGYCRDARHKPLPPSHLTERPKPISPRNPKNYPGDSTKPSALARESYPEGKSYPEGELAPAAGLVTGTSGRPMKQLLKTLVKRIEYDFTELTGRLYMDAGCCCDMSDCIDFFKTIDPNVTCISTMAGACPEQDTCYRLIEGEWRAFLWRDDHFIPAPPS